jgi:hypothetical protein
MTGNSSERSQLLDPQQHHPLHHQNSSRRLEEDVPLYAQPKQRQVRTAAADGSAIRMDLL